MVLVALRLVAYILHPPWAKWLQRVLFVLVYSLVVMTGVRAIYIPEGGGVLLALDGWLMVLAGLVSTYGALGRLYNIESIGLYLAVAGLAGGAWWAGAIGAWYTAYVVVAVAGLFGLRLLTLNRIDAAMRAEHHLTNGGP